MAAKHRKAARKALIKAQQEEARQQRHYKRFKRDYCSKVAKARTKALLFGMAADIPRGKV